MWKVWKFEKSEKEWIGIGSARLCLNSASMQERSRAEKTFTPSGFPPMTSWAGTKHSQIYDVIKQVCHLLKMSFWSKNLETLLDKLSGRLKHHTLIYGTVSQPFFNSRNPYLVIKPFGGTPSYNLLVNRRQGDKLTAPLVLSRHPRVPRHPGWEPLV